jgi:hypothetical protein
LWSSGVKKLPPLSPLLVKGRNLYKQKTYRQVSINQFLQGFIFFTSCFDVFPMLIAQDVSICCFAVICHALEMEK